MEDHEFKANLDKVVDPLPYLKKKNNPQKSFYENVVHTEKYVIYMPNPQMQWLKLYDKF